MGPAKSRLILAMGPYTIAAVKNMINLFKEER